MTYFSKGFCYSFSDPLVFILERWKQLPRAFLSPHVTVLPLIPDLEGCLKAIRSSEPRVEGLVFKSTRTPGFSDTSIVRCRKRS